MYPTSFPRAPGRALLESDDGSLDPGGTQRLFHTGERFRGKQPTPRDAAVAPHDTTPTGELRRRPVWPGAVLRGGETITPRLRLGGRPGTDLLHIGKQAARMAGTPGVLTWLGRWLAHPPANRRTPHAGGVGSAQDVSLDRQCTGAATDLLNPDGQGVVATLRIARR